MQAKDISDDQLIAAVKAVRRPYGISTSFDIYAQLGDFPEKVVLAKLRSAVKRGILTGCACGCRGDFEIVKPSMTPPAPVATGEER